ncbi:MAG: methyltransferase domain-containing protein [Alphaproteobacteria bacterium]|nr:methyltransferase domain-containing protein [Alphaproteobacteria bacterium]
MYSSVYDLKAFYDTRAGRVVRRVLQERIRTLWPDVRGLRVMGTGYATPYLRMFMEESERVFSMMPAGQGAHHWPRCEKEKNLVGLSLKGALPLETNSIDRILMIHDLEFSENVHLDLSEIWRVLKSSGRILVVVPNRAGLWAHADWSPFGQGTPYTVRQLCEHLRENLFVHERTEEALFMPPSRSSLFLKSAGFFERTGARYVPIAAGVHMIEASKQLYARADKGSGSRVRVGVPAIPAIARTARS